MALPNDPIKIKGNIYAKCYSNIRTRGYSLSFTREKLLYEGNVDPASEGKVDLSQGGSPHGQRGEYTCKGKVDLGEGTVSEGKLIGHDGNHHHHVRLHPSLPPPNNNLVRF